MDLQGGGNRQSFTFLVAGGEALVKGQRTG